MKKGSLAPLCLEKEKPGYSLLMAETVADLGAPQLVACRVQSSEPVLIDGEPWSGQYEGMYFRGQKITATPREGKAFSHWEVDGRNVAGPRLELVLESDTRISAVFLPQAG